MEFNATFLVSAVSFILFTLIMNKILYQPVSEIIAKRQKYIDDNYAVSKENFDKASAIREEKDKKILDSKAAAKNAIMTEVELAKQRKSLVESEKRSEMMSRISDEKKSLISEKERVANELKLSVDDISNSIIAKLTEGEK